MSFRVALLFAIIILMVFTSAHSREPLAEKVQMTTEIVTGRSSYPDVDPTRNDHHSARFVQEAGREARTGDAAQPVP
jgi:hypothetical protein